MYSNVLHIQKEFYFDCSWFFVEFHKTGIDSNFHLQNCKRIASTNHIENQNSWPTIKQTRWHEMEKHFAYFILIMQNNCPKLMLTMAIVVCGEMHMIQIFGKIDIIWQRIEGSHSLISVAISHWKRKFHVEIVLPAHSGMNGINAMKRIFVL